MSEITDRAKAVLDNLKGSTFTAPRALEIVQDFNNDDTATADESAQQFIDTLARIVRRTVKSHNEQQAAADYQAAIEQAGDDAVTDL